jgi:hypothetical protein
MMTRSISLLLAAWAMASPLQLHAQFVTPLPSSRGPEAVITASYQYRFRHFLTPQVRAQVEKSTISADSLEALQTRFCDTEPAAAKTTCVDAVDARGMSERRSTAPVHQSRTVLRLKSPFTRSRAEVEDYVKSATGADGLRLFGSFAANVSDKEAYVLTDIISGLAGTMMFAINYAAVVVKDEAESQSERQSIESQKSNIIRMINNGGTLSGRFQFPVYARSGPTFQTSSSLYSTMGLIGPIGNTDSLRFASSVVAEVMTGLSIRDPGQTAGLLGELIAGARIGYAFSEKELLSDTDDRGFPFAQLAIGLRQSGKVNLSALVTWPMEQKYQPFSPKLVVNFSALR